MFRRIIESEFSLRVNVPPSASSVVDRGHHRRKRGSQFMRKHRQEIIFRPVGRFDGVFLLLDRGLSAVASAIAAAICHRRDRQRGRPRLQHQERLISVCKNERAESVKCSPDCDRRENENAGGGFARRESERGPDDDWSANK